MFQQGLFTLERPICDCYENHPNLTAGDIYGWDIRETSDGLALVLRCQICTTTLVIPGQKFRMGIQILQPRQAAPSTTTRMDMDLELEETLEEIERTIESIGQRMAETKTSGLDIAEEHPVRQVLPFPGQKT